MLDRGHVAGWVATKDLRDAPKVRSVMKRLDHSAVVSAEASMSSALKLLGDHRLVFTAGEIGLAGFIVPSDLDRHAARGYFYLLIAAIEMLLSEIVGSSAPIEVIEAEMPEDMRQRYDEARAADQEASPVEYLYLEQLVGLFVNSGYGAATANWSDTDTSRLVAVNQFRSAVMHPTRSMVARREPGQLADLASQCMQVSATLQDIIDRS